MSQTSEPRDEPGAEKAPPPGNQPLANEPMGCQPSIEELFKYMDGQMDAKRQAAVQSHLSHCQGCDEIYHFQAGFRHLLHERCRAELPKDLSKRIFRSINDQD